MAVIAVALTIRPPLPVDETRYLAVAWDMWLHENYLVPHLNGAPYSHKPPLLFWLMTGGWHLLGVNEWWPRLVAPLFSIGSLILIHRLARILWPGSADARNLSPILLFGSFFWCVFSTLTMFDMMLTFLTLLAVINMAQATYKNLWCRFIVAGVAMGFGVLSKGPAIFIHVLPIAVTAPFWAPHLACAAKKFEKRGWYTGVALSVLIATTIGLSWAIPAGIAGGEAYRDAIFWGQSAGRMVESFAHARPFWWYFAALPLLILPWLLWPALWRVGREANNLMGEGGFKFCVIWFIAPFTIFSIISGKQLHYLLPEFPALALIGSRLLTIPGVTPFKDHQLDRWLPGGSAIILGGFLLLASHLPFEGQTAILFRESDGIWGILILVVGSLYLFSPINNTVHQAAHIAAITACSVMAIYLAATPILSKRYDLRKLAQHISALENDGKAVAYFGKYHGQFHFMGQLKNSISPIGLIGDDIIEFLNAHPDGVIIAKYKTLPKEADPLFTYRFRNYTYASWSAAVMLANPNIGDRR